MQMLEIGSKHKHTQLYCWKPRKRRLDGASRTNDKITRNMGEHTAEKPDDNNDEDATTSRRNVYTGYNERSGDTGEQIHNNDTREEKQDTQHWEPTTLKIKQEMNKQDKNAD